MRRYLSRRKGNCYPLYVCHRVRVHICAWLKLKSLPYLLELYEEYLFNKEEIRRECGKKKGKNSIVL